MIRWWTFLTLLFLLSTLVLKASTPYTVAQGDTLWKISHQFGCTITELKSENNLRSDLLHPGQVLDIPDTIPTATPVATTSSPVALPVTPVANTEPARVIVAPDTTILGDDPRWDKTSTPPSSLNAEAVPENQTAAAPPPVATPVTPAQTNANDWALKFLQASRDLAARGLDYDETWRPPGEENEWVMDCSNTSRYLYKAVARITLPRCASDQYEDLRQQNAAWDVPQDNHGLPDVAYLQNHLQPGDLLFWENTYKPERDPPITHVMIFLGTNVQGKWIMAGCQSGPGGHHNRHHGGPDIYYFNPQQPCGGYSSWFSHKTGRFCAYGRPLAADAGKLALAASH